MTLKNECCDKCKQTSGFLYSKFCDIPSCECHPTTTEKKCEHKITLLGGDVPFCPLCRAKGSDLNPTADTSDPYLKPYYTVDHSHCWESKTPPCGIKGEHRCCLCEMPKPDMSDWRERFDNLERGWTKELERALTEQRRVTFQMYRQIGDPDKANSILEERFKAGQQAEQSRIIALAEGMKKNNEWSEGYDDGHDAALDTLISKIKEPYA